MAQPDGLDGVKRSQTLKWEEKRGQVGRPRRRPPVKARRKLDAKGAGRAALGLIFRDPLACAPGGSALPFGEGRVSDRSNRFRTEGGTGERDRRSQIRGRASGGGSPGTDGRGAVLKTGDLYGKVSVPSKVCPKSNVVEWNLGIAPDAVSN